VAAAVVITRQITQAAQLLHLVKAMQAVQDTAQRTVAVAAAVLVQ
jgi:hypothetical protein